METKMTNQQDKLTRVLTALRAVVERYQNWRHAELGRWPQANEARRIALSNFNQVVKEIVG